MDATFFPTPDDFRRWLQEHHASERELLVGFHKTGSGKPSITWPQSVDEALCFGWIDGVRRRIDDDSYSIRFTPRKASSNWSAVNVKRMGELIAAGRVAPAGMAAWEKRSAARTGIYAYENRKEIALAPEYEAELRANPAAWEHLSTEAPWYRHLVVYRVMSAKKEETRLRRLRELIACSAAGKRLGMLEQHAPRSKKAKSGEPDGHEPASPASRRPGSKARKSQPGKV